MILDSSNKENIRIYMKNILIQYPKVLTLYTANLSVHEINICTMYVRV